MALPDSQATSVPRSPFAGRWSAWWGLFILGLAGLVPTSPAEAIRHPNHFFLFETPDDRWYFGGDEDFLVVTVLAVRDSVSTNSHPPEVIVRIEEVLRGRLERGSTAIGWPPVPMYLPCPVGEGENIRRWQNTPLPGPSIGRRMILGGHMTAEGLWLSDAMLRWDDDGSPKADEVRRKIREWGPSAAARQRREARAREEASRRDHAERLRLEAERTQAQRLWLRNERAIREESDVAALVRQSDAIFVASPPQPERPGGAWPRTMRVFEWILGPGDSSSSAPHFASFGREAPRDSVVRRWLAAPLDDGPGEERGDSIRCVVFVRISHEPRPGRGATFFRPADAIRGMLLADSSVVRAAREAVARRGDTPVEPPSGCGASLLEFAGADTVEAAGIALKLTAFPSNSGSVVLACGPVGTHSGFTAVHAGTFPPCAGSNRLAADDHEGALQLLVRPRVMSALLDSLATLPRLLAGTFEPSDGVTLSLHRVVSGRHRVYDATLDSTSVTAVNRFLAALLTEQGVARWNLPRFWGEVNPRLLAAWQDRPRVPAVSPSTPAAAPSPRVSEGESTILGVIVDEVTREPLPGFMIHTTRPRRFVETGRDGIFALTRLPAGTRGMLVYGPGHAPSYAEADLERGEVQLLVLRVLREGARPSSARLRRRAMQPFLLPSLRTRLVVEVRDPEGRPVAGAHVRLEHAGRLAAGFTDFEGRKWFDELPQGPVHLFVQATGHATFKGQADVRSYLPQTFEVTLPSTSPSF